MEKMTLELEKAISRNQVAVLDSGYILTGLVPWERAVSLVVTDQANILIPRSDGSTVRSPSLSIPHPLVVSLKRFVGKRERTFDDGEIVSKTAILVRDDWTCYICGEYGDTVDHLIPRARGGKSVYGNLAAACMDCNSQKGDSTMEELGWEWPNIPRTIVSKRREVLETAIYSHLESLVA